MNDRTSAMFERLAESMGQTVETVYPYFVKQSMLYGIFSILAFIVLIAGLSFICRYIKAKKVELMEGDNEIILSLSYVVLGVALLFFIGNLPTLISMVFNPEYHAITNIISIVR